MYKVASSPTVLVVDDEPANHLVVEGALSPFGIEVVSVRSSAEAEGFLTLSQPDLVLLDVLLAGEDGIDVCRRWRGRPEWEELPIILVTGLAASSHRREALGAGADDYVEKPIDIDQLHRLVRRWVATGRHRGSLSVVDSEGGGALGVAMERAARRRH
jgi:CheY-like chemotaxis protein